LTPWLSIPSLPVNLAQHQAFVGLAVVALVALAIFRKWFVLLVAVVVIVLAFVLGVVVYRVGP
jgi:hypothetical protein